MAPNVSQTASAMPRVTRLSPLQAEFFFVCFCFFVFFKAAPMAYGSSQARGLIRSMCAGLHQRHSNAGSEPRL